MTGDDFQSNRLRSRLRGLTPRRDIDALVQGPVTAAAQAVLGDQVIFLRSRIIDDM